MPSHTSCESSYPGDNLPFLSEYNDSAGCQANERKDDLDDYRDRVASYYDHCPDMPGDVPFYKDIIGDRPVRILELGCGTGRVLLPLVELAQAIVGVDHSQGMLDVCLQQLCDRGVPENRARVQAGDITELDLGEKFDLIIAPYPPVSRRQIGPGDIGSLFLRVSFSKAKDPGQKAGISLWIAPRRATRCHGAQ